MPPIKTNKERDVEDFFNISGATMNRTRKTSPPTPQIKPANKVAPPHIDLFNFEEPQFEDGKYVLTSPRSLEACSRVGVKPVEILYRPLIEFQEDLTPDGYSLRTIYEIYDEQEKERQNKLQLCREERERVIKEDEELGVGKDSGPIIATSLGQAPIHTALTQKGSVREVKHGYSSAEDEGQHPKERTATTGSAHRTRTAWVTSIGHDRVTKEELDQRAEDIHKKGRDLARASHPRRRPKSAPGRNTARAGSNRNTAQTPQSGRSADGLRKKQARLKKAESHRVSEESITDGSSITSSRASRPWIKDPLADARPVTDPVLRQKLNSVSGSGTRLSSRDQKILQLMISKREAEKRQEAERESVRTKWEEDRRREAAARNSAENQRRKSISEKKRGSTSDLNSRQHQHHHHHHNGTDEPCSCGRDHDRQVETPSRTGRRSETTPRRPTEKDSSAEHCQRSWVVASQKRLEMQKQQMQEKKMREMERKRSVEKRLEEQKREKEEYHQQMKDKQAQALQRAESLRMSKEQQRELRIRLKNFQEKQRHEEKLNQIKRQSMEDLAAMKASIDLKDHLSNHKHKEIQGCYTNEQKRRSFDLDSRLKQSKDNKTKMDRELQTWRADLFQYQQLQKDRAEKLAKERAAEKSRKAQESRNAKQQAQKDNMKKLLSAEEEWKAEVEATIALKDTKSKMLQREKEEVIQESRAMAQTSQRLREDLRQHYSMNDLDKLNRQAELEARFSSRPARPKTTSTS